MKRTLRPTLLFLSTLAAACIPLRAQESAPLSPVKIAAETWEGCTAEGGKGAFFELLTEIFAAEGVKLEFTLVPYERSVKMVENGSADLWVGAYDDEEDWAVFPETAFSVDRVAALFKVGRFPEWKGAESLNGVQVVWMRGYSFNDYIEVPMQFREIDDPAAGIQLVQRGRADAYLDEIEDMQGYLEKSGADPAGFELKEIAKIPLYFGA